MLEITILLFLFLSAGPGQEYLKAKEQIKADRLLWDDIRFKCICIIKFDF
jgi:hypothetical protein